MAVDDQTVASRLDRLGDIVISAGDAGIKVQDSRVRALIVVIALPGGDCSTSSSEVIEETLSAGLVQGMAVCDCYGPLTSWRSNVVRAGVLVPGVFVWVLVCEVGNVVWVIDEGEVADGQL